MIDIFQSLFLAVLLFSSSTNLNVVILKDSVNAVSVSNTYLFIPFSGTHLHFIQLHFFNILFGHICVCHNMNENCMCSLMNCYLLMQFLSSDIHEGFLVNLPQMFYQLQMSKTWMFVAGCFVRDVFTVGSVMSRSVNQIFTAVDLSSLGQIQFSSCLKNIGILMFSYVENKVCTGLDKMQGGIEVQKTFFFLFS